MRSCYQQIHLYSMIFFWTMHGDQISATYWAAIVTIFKEFQYFGTIFQTANLGKFVKLRPFSPKCMRAHFSVGAEIPLYYVNVDQKGHGNFFDKIILQSLKGLGRAAANLSGLRKKVSNESYLLLCNLKIYSSHFFCAAEGRRVMEALNVDCQLNQICPAKVVASTVFYSNFSNFPNSRDTKIFMDTSLQIT